MSFTLRPELFEHRSQIMACLESAGIVWLQDYRSIDVEHSDHMLEICGISDDATARKIQSAVAAAMPGCKFDLWEKDYGLEPGWVVEVYIPQPAHSVGEAAR